MMPEQPTKQWYTFEELSAYLEIPEKLIRKYVNEGTFPGPIKLSSRKYAYHYSDLQTLEWMLAHRDRFRVGECPPEPEEA